MYVANVLPVVDMHYGPDIPADLRAQIVAQELARAENTAALDRQAHERRQQHEVDCYSANIACHVCGGLMESAVREVEEEGERGWCARCLHGSCWRCVVLVPM